MGTQLATHTVDLDEIIPSLSLCISPSSTHTLTLVHTRFNFYYLPFVQIKAAQVARGD